MYGGSRNGNLIRGITTESTISTDPSNPEKTIKYLVSSNCHKTAPVEPSLFCTIGCAARYKTTTSFSKSPNPTTSPFFSNSSLQTSLPSLAAQAATSASVALATISIPSPGFRRALELFTALSNLCLHTTAPSFGLTAPMMDFSERV